jgi:hypothetical protein
MVRGKVGRRINGTTSARFFKKCSTMRHLEKRRNEEKAMRRIILTIAALAVLWPASASAVKAQVIGPVITTPSVEVAWRPYRRWAYRPYYYRGYYRPYYWGGYYRPYYYYYGPGFYGYGPYYGGWYW